MPDAPRSDVVARLAELAGIVEDALPSHVAVGLSRDFESVATLLLARLAGLCRSVAELADAGRDLDAGMVMRGALEHVTLLAWLAIDPQELAPEAREGRDWSARGREDNTRWWMAHQFLKDVRRSGRLAHAFPGHHDERAHQDALGFVRTTFKVELTWGRLPRLGEMAAEGDAVWGGRLAGWPAAEPGEIGYDTTLRGFNQLLHEVGNTSAHPHLGALTRAFTDAPNTDDTAPLHVEEPSKSVEVPVATTAYLMLYAVSVAQYALGWTCLDDALNVLGRFADVRHPGMLLDAVSVVLGQEDGERYGTVAEVGSVLVARDGDETTVVLVADGSWHRAGHAPGSFWTFEDGHGSAVATAGRHEMTGEVVQRITAMLAAVLGADWLPQGDRPGDWPASLEWCTGPSAAAPRGERDERQ